MTANLVIVELPAKAKTINKYLGSDYKVLASFGHVRDLIEKDAAVEPDQDFAMHWEVGDRATRPLGEISKALKGAKRLYLATDPDREGEAISWHLREVLKEAKKIGSIEVKRVVFNEITKNAILEAMKHPRDIDFRPGRGLSRPPGARFPRRFHSFSRPLAPHARQPLGRPRPVGRPAHHLRARKRDRALQGA